MRPALAVLYALVLLAYVGWAYAPMLDNYFYSDDFTFVAGAIMAQFDRSVWFSTELWNNFNAFEHVTISLDLALTGVDPSSFQATNLVIHLLATLAAAALATEMLGSVAWGLGAATFWSTSALISEPVLWMDARAHSLVGLFGFAAIFAHLRALRGRPVRWSIVSATSVMLGLATKETAVAVVVLLVWATLLGREGTAARRYSLLAAPVASVALFLAWRITHISVPPMSSGPARMGLKLLFALDGYFLPGYRAGGEGILGIGFLIFAGLVVLVGRRPDRAGLLAAGIVLVPLGVSLPRPMHSSRYDYLPFLGAVLLVALALRMLLERISAKPFALAVIVTILAATYLPSQFLFLRQEERDYALLGSETKRMVDLYADTLRSIPCGARVLFVNRTSNRLSMIARWLLLHGGMPKLIQRRPKAPQEMVPADMLTTFVRFGEEPACACLFEGDDADPVDGVLIFEDGSATWIEGPAGGTRPPGEDALSVRAVTFLM